MNKQYMKEVQKRKKGLLEIAGSKNDDARAVFTVQSSRTESDIFTVQKAEAKVM